MKTIVLDIESGLMTVNQWLRTKSGDHVQTIKIAEFQDFLDITVLACGPDRSASPQSPMSQAHHDHVMTTRKAAGHDVDAEKKMFQDADVFFIDSISDLTKLAFAHAKQRETTNNLMRVYGNMAQDVLNSLRHWQHNHMKTVIFSCKLNSIEDDLGRITYEIEAEGRRIKNELPGIVDEVLTLAFIPQPPKDGVKQVLLYAQAPTLEGTLRKIVVVAWRELNSLIGETCSKKCVMAEPRKKALPIKPRLLSFHNQMETTYE